MGKYYTNIKCIIFIIVLIFSNCSEGKKTIISNDSGNNQDNNDVENELVFLSIKLTCSPNNNPVLCKVIVFDVEKKN